jgi:hypothetical protein
MEVAATVRRALPDDAEAFSACHYACWQEAYGELWEPERFDALDPADRHRPPKAHGQLPLDHAFQ